MLHIFKIVTVVLACAGCASLLISGEVSPFMAITGIGIFPGYYRFLRGMPQAPRWAIGAASIITLFVFLIDAVVISQDYFLAVAHLTITFQAIKSFDLREPWDHLQVYFVSLLQLVVASELTQSIALGIILVLFLIAFVTAMVLAHFMKEGAASKIRIGRPIAIVSMSTVIVSVLFFVALPRMMGGIWSKGHMKGVRTVGFSEKVDFGAFGDLKLDPTVVMRVEIKGDTRGPFYWRGRTLDHFDGFSWQATSKDRSWSYNRAGVFSLMPLDEKKATVQRILLEPMDTEVIFGLRDVAEVEAPWRLLAVDRAGSLFLPGKRNKKVSYAIRSIRGSPIQGDAGRNDLQLPAGTEEISRLARFVTLNIKEDRGRAAGIERYLKENFTYTLSPPPPHAGTSPVEDFLFHSKRGYCEHYATAMVLMLRTLGIPARIVTGFAGGELNEYGEYFIVRESNAHSWVEAMIDGRWKTFDPTPSVADEIPSKLAFFLDMLRMKWDRYVVSFTASDQREIIRAFSMPFRLREMPHVRTGSLTVVLFFSVLALLAILLYLKPFRIRRAGFPTAQYVELRALLRRRGGKVIPSSTPSEVSREAIRLGMGHGTEEFIRMYEGCRFGGRDIRGESRERFEKLLKDIGRRTKSGRTKNP